MYTANAREWKNTHLSGHFGTLRGQDKHTTRDLYTRGYAHARTRHRHRRRGACWTEKQRSGEVPYILHPVRLMMRVDGLDAKMAAILHDVVEDTAQLDARPLARRRIFGSRARGGRFPHASRRRGLILRGCRASRRESIGEAGEARRSRGQHESHAARGRARQRFGADAAIPQGMDVAQRIIASGTSQARPRIRQPDGGTRQAGGRRRRIRNSPTASPRVCWC